ncbi:MAG: hypothetical protein KAI47_27270, partial [Deltaproteobacteria bacterium]|nr:hypothetical protein [Deltaproteobacteria bacterium]
MGWQTKLRPGVLFDRIRSRAWVWGLFLLLAFLDQTWWGYRFGDTNQSFQVPILKSYFDSALYSGDLLMQTRSHYTTVYYFLLGLINQVVGNLELVFFAVHLLVIALLFGAIHRLARTTFKRPGVGLLAVLQMLPRRFDIQLGGGFLHRAFHTHTLAASPIVLFAISKFLDGKQTLAFFLLGLIFNINAQSVLFVFAMLALTSAIRWREYGLKTMARWLGVFVLAASPVLIWILTAAGEPLTQEWLRLLRIRSSHHSFPLTWPAAHWAIYGLFLSFGLIAWSLVRRGGENRSTHNAFGWFTVAFAVLCGMGLVFSAWVPVKLVLRANLFRSSAFMTVFVLIYGSNMVRTLWDGRNGEKALAVLIFLTLFFPAYRMWLVPLMLLLPIVLHRKIDWWAAIPGAAMVIVAARTPSVRFGALDLRPVRQFLGAFVDRPPLASLSVTILGWLGLRKIPARVRRPIVA